MDTNTKIQIFSNNQFGEIRTIVNENDEPLFAATDVCKMLGYSNSRKAISDHTEPEERCNVSLHRGGRMTFINESGLYSLILRSNKPEDKLVKKWVTSEVLPAIRKTGGYIKTSIDDSPETIMAKALVLAQETLTRHTEQINKLSQQNRIISQKAEILAVANEELMSENKELAPKAEYTDAVLQSLNTYTMTQIGKELNFESVGKFTSALKSKGIMFRQSGQWLLTSKHAGNDYTKTRTFHYPDSKGIERTNTITVWTEKGRAFLHQLRKGGRI